MAHYAFPGRPYRTSPASAASGPLWPLFTLSAKAWEWELTGRQLPRYILVITAQSHNGRHRKYVAKVVAPPEEIPMPWTPLAIVLWPLSAMRNRLTYDAARSPPTNGFWRTPSKHSSTAQWIIRYTNQARAKHNRRPLRRYVRLQSAAQEHSDWMARTGSFGHQGHHGSSPHIRMRLAGFDEPATAENIYKYPSTKGRKRLAKGLVDGWMKSPGHRANILNRDLRFIGVGVAESDGYVYATQNFGG